MTIENKTSKFLGITIRKPIKSLLIISLSALLLVVILLAVSPSIVRNQLEKHGKEWVGRKLKINDLSVNYFTSTITLTGTTMFEANDKDQFVSLDSLILDVDPLEYFSSSIVVEQLYIKNLQLNISHKDSIFNVDDLIAFYSSEDQNDTIVEKQEDAYLFSLSDFRLNGGTLNYSDQSHDVTQTLNNLSFYLPHVEWGRGSSKLDASFKLSDGGRFGIASEFDSKKGDYLLHVEMDSLDISAFKPYTKDYLKIGDLTGLAHGKVDISGNLNTVNTLSIQGISSLENFALTDDSGRTFLSAQKVVCPIEKLMPMQSFYALGDISIHAPNVDFELFKESNNFYRSFGLEEPETAPVTHTDTKEETEMPLVYTLKSVQVDEGKLKFTDHTTSSPFVYNFSKVKMDFNEIKSDAHWVNGKASMVLNERGKLEADIGFNPKDAAMNMKVNYVISDFQLSDLNIYSMEYTGYPILYGDMYYKGNIDIDKGKLNLENKLIVHNAEVGNKKGSPFYNLPLKVALFILKDKDGVINMDIPVRGDLNDPQVNIRKIVWRTFGKFLVKTVTSPFRALSNLINVDPGDIREINYTYMDTTLVARREHQLNLLRRLEKSKPGLDIELVYFNDKNKQKEEIAKELNLLDTMKIDSVSKVFDAVRVASVKAYLAKQSNDSTKIKITIPSPTNLKNTGAQPVFEIKYKMQGEEQQDFKIVEE
ncbi:DUF748 domain-containing protein [Aestuariibaculum suncheonense]|uniref:DUF748 domain-containing protein n=1 Tax=Aestuariibaculum suncheonense TaxID=1028745 RepID=A0A8J6Q6F7_9FLAO|nr:DUF748 domain-containing protein [Aestuariibaculum suncheonense]MBD0835553.1 DUF748 domain-containing protein [Aestuariibaculum suncheonense]